jgi:hypothetical protein
VAPQAGSVGQGGLQVRPEVLDVLDPHREAHERLGDVRALVGPPASSLDERLHATEARPVHDQRGRLAHPLRVVGLARRLERQDGAEPRHLPDRELVARVVGQSRVAHPDDARVLDEPLGDHLRGLGGPAHPQPEGADAAQHQPGLERSWDAAEEGAGALEAVAELEVARHEGAHDDVRVTGQGLRRAVQHDVGAEVQRSLQDRRREGVVHHGHDTVPLGRGAGRREVADLQGRVRGALQPQQRRTVARLVDEVGVVRGDEADLAPAARLPVGEARGDPRVGVGGRHHHAPDRDQLEQGAHGGHAAREGECRAALQRPDRLSSASHVGFEVRAYPTGPPAWKVEDSTTGGLSGASGAAAGRPAVTATVSGDRGIGFGDVLTP